MDEDEVLAAILLLENMEMVEEDANYPVRRLRQNEDPFDLPERQFLKYFRVTKRLAEYLIEIVTPFVVQPTRVSALDTRRKVLIALRFFGFGSYQEITGSNIFTSVSQSSVSICIEEICNALCHPAIFNEWVRFPRNVRELQTLRTRFYEKYNFPGIVGCVDCTHVAIIRPSSYDPERPEHIYVNRKNYHSINVQLICDLDLKILNVNARFPGSTHDAHIWGESAVSNLMERVYRQFNNNVFFLLGDSGYPLRPWLLTPLRETHNNSEERFNNAFMSIRSMIERCNGVLKNRFRCLLKHRVLHYKPSKAAKIINSCVVLHNMCIEFNIPEPEVDEELGDMGMYNNLLDEVNGDNERHMRINPDLVAARNLQRNIVNNYFR